MKKKYVNILKKLLSISLSVFFALSCFACQTCTHRDADDNGVCDSCGVEFSDGEELNGDLSSGDSSNDSSFDESDDNGGSSDDDVKNDEMCEQCGGELTDGECAACKPAAKTCALCRDEYTGEQCEFCDGERPSSGTANPLNGKKIIFIGNSYTYYGQTVHNGSSKNLKQSERTGDKAFFYQLCKNNGVNVTVTNWTFDGHNIRWLFNGSCGATSKTCVGVDHKSYLTDKNFDYVVLQPGKDDIFDGTSAADKAAVQSLFDFFKEGNPNVKFVFLVPYYCYGTIGSGTPTMTKTYLNNLKQYESQGAIVSDWGKVVMDILNGTVQVPNSTLSYTKNTFVISKSASDGYHPNMLSGYITTLMTYCAITGERARGKTYAFCNDSSLNTTSVNYYFSFANFITKFYTYPSGVTTNFDKVFASENDMLGIQKIIDANLKLKGYKTYNY